MENNEKQRYIDNIHCETQDLMIMQALIKRSIHGRMMPKADDHRKATERSDC